MKGVLRKENKKFIFLFFVILFFKCIFFLFIFSDEYLQWHLLLPNNIDKYNALNILPQGLIYMVYAEFGMVLLDIKIKYSWLFKLTRAFQVLTFMITFSHCGYLFLSGGDQAFIYQYFFNMIGLGKLQIVMQEFI